MASEKSLIKKLGIKEGFKVRVINQPDNYFELLGSLPEKVQIIKCDKETVDLIHLFVTESQELRQKLSELRSQIYKNGAIWISWTKKSSKIHSDLNENLIRNIAVNSGLVDVKVVTIDETWSGLKLVYRLKDR